MCRPWVEGFRKGQSMRLALTLRWIWRQCGAQMGRETSRSGVHREGLWPGLQARGRNDFSICGSLPLCPWGGQSQLLAGIWKKESFSVMCIVGGGYLGARNGVHLLPPWWGECLRGRGLDPVSCLWWQVGWGLGFQGQRRGWEGGTGRDEHRPHTSESHLPPGRGRGSKVSGGPGGQACPGIQGPPHPLPCRPADPTFFGVTPELAARPVPSGWSACSPPTQARTHHIFHCFSKELSQHKSTCLFVCLSASPGLCPSQSLNFSFFLAVSLGLRGLRSMRLEPL